MQFKNFIETGEFDKNQLQSQNRNLGSGEGTAGDDRSINTVCNMNAWKAWLFTREPRRSKLWENPTNSVTKSRGEGVQEGRQVGDDSNIWRPHYDLWMADNLAAPYVTVLDCSLMTSRSFWTRAGTGSALEGGENKTCHQRLKKQIRKCPNTQAMTITYLKSTLNECSTFLIVMNCQKLLAWESNWLQYLLHYPFLFAKAYS